jgi:gliding motility-associated-like protein
MYQSVCASCYNPDTRENPKNDFPTSTGAWSQTDPSNNCNNASFKFNFDLLSKVRSNFSKTLVGSVSGCAPYTYQLKNLSEKADHYFWDFGNGQTSTDFEPKVTYKQSGIYKLKLVAYSNNPCIVSDSLIQDVFIYSESEPQFAFTLDSCAGTYSITNKSRGGLTFQWRINGEWIGDSAFTPGPNFPTNFPPGTYEVEVVGNPRTPCESAFKGTVTILPEATSELYLIPNAFSPNGDGINDRFTIIGGKAECIESLEIFDRWGVSVFFTTDLHQSWDGTFNGNKVHEGVFVYVLRVKGSVRTGTITVLR